VLANTRRMTGIIAHHSGRSFVEVECDIGRDYFMTAREALDYGLIDRVLTPLRGVSATGAEERPQRLPSRAAGG
jgi:ATP-dependent Clp protease protease subunit